MYSPFFHSPHMKGPVPIGWAKLPSAATESGEIMPVKPHSGRDIRPRKTADGFASVISTVAASVALTPATDAAPPSAKSFKQVHFVSGLR